jgi:hypothetical protein
LILRADGNKQLPNIPWLGNLYTKELTEILFDEQGGAEEKSVCAVSGLEWGSYTDAEMRKTK